MIQATLFHTKSTLQTNSATFANYNFLPLFPHFSTDKMVNLYDSSAKSQSFVKRRGIQTHRLPNAALEIMDSIITKIYLYNFDPSNPTFLYSKTGVYRGIHNLLISAQKHRLWVLVRTASTRRF